MMRWVGVIRCAFLDMRMRSLTKHHAVADQVVRSVPEYAGWYGMQDEALVSVLYGMAGVGTALETRNDVVPLGKHVYDLAFSLVSPLETEYYVYSCFIVAHLSHVIKIRTGGRLLSRQPAYLRLA